jgi:hypothetical protein
MSTGVRILPRDTRGYMIDGVLATYQQARAIQEHIAASRPELRAEMAWCARHLNITHLRRLLRSAANKTDAAWDPSYWFIENLPRAQRRLLKRESWPYPFAPGRSQRYDTGLIPPNPGDIDDRI